MERDMKVSLSPGGYVGSTTSGGAVDGVSVSGLSVVVGDSDDDVVGESEVGGVPKVVGLSVVGFFVVDCDSVVVVVGSVVLGG